MNSFNYSSKYNNFYINNRIRISAIKLLIQVLKYVYYYSNMNRCNYTFLFICFFILDIINLALFSSLISFNKFAFDSSNHF